MTAAESAPNKQVASAVGEGATATLMIRNYWRNSRGTAGIRGIHTIRHRNLSPN